MDCPAAFLMMTRYCKYIIPDPKGVTSQLVDCRHRVVTLSGMTLHLIRCCHIQEMIMTLAGEVVKLFSSTMRQLNTREKVHIASNRFLLVLRRMCSPV